MVADNFCSRCGKPFDSSISHKMYIEQIGKNKNGKEIIKEINLKEELCPKCSETEMPYKISITPIYTLLDMVFSMIIGFGVGILSKVNQNFGFFIIVVSGILIMFYYSIKYKHFKNFFKRYL